MGSPATMQPDEEDAFPLMPLDRDLEKSEEWNATSAPGAKLKHRTPLPLLQLSVLCGARLAEPIAYTQIFPVRPNFY